MDNEEQEERNPDVAQELASPGEHDGERRYILGDYLETSAKHKITDQDSVPQHRLAKKSTSEKNLRGLTGAMGEGEQANAHQRGAKYKRKGRDRMKAVEKSHALAPVGAEAMKEGVLNNERMPSLLGIPAPSLYRCDGAAL